MKQQKTWLTVRFSEGDATIEATLNYEKQSYSLTHGSNDNNCTFVGKTYDEFKISTDRAKCVASALRFIKQELF